MKRCPSCNLNYTDATLEFCLEDGSRLLALTDQTVPATLPRTEAPLSAPAAEKTVALPFADTARNLENKPEDNLRTNPAGAPLTERIAVQGGNVLEITPVVISLAHNWWQWLYLENFYYYSFTAYIFSANFLMWLLLLIGGVAAGLLALRRSANKAFAITGLVVLAVNLLLFLVPRK